MHVQLNNISVNNIVAAKQLPSRPKLLADGAFKST